MKISRRHLLVGGGTMAAGMTLLKGLVPDSADSATLLDDWTNHQEEWSLSVCQQCVGGCGVMVRQMDGRAVRIEGNPLHPVNQGGLCPKGLASLQGLYDPDRLTTPLRAKGKRGSGEFEPISWKDAAALVAGRLKTLRQEGKAHTALMLGGQFRGQRHGLFSRFWSAYGSPNYLRLRCVAPDEPAAAHAFMNGVSSPLAYDLAESRYVLAFGCNLLETGPAPVHQAAQFGRLRVRQDGGAHVTVVDPRMSVSAAKADLWVPVRPGTDGVLALAIAHVMLKENRYDKAFVAAHVQGFERFRQQVLAQYSPAIAAQITGIPEDTIRKIAQDFAPTGRPGEKPAVALGERGPAYSGDDLRTRLAIHALNALSGSLGKAGGVVLQTPAPLAPWPALPQDAPAKTGLSHPPLANRDMGALLAALKAGKSSAKGYPVNALFLYYANPAFSLGGGREEWNQAIQNIPLVVSFSPWLDDSARQADLILPDAHWLERWQDDSVSHLPGFASFSAAPPALPAAGGLPTEEFFLELARALGGTTAQALPWKTYGDVLAHKAQGLYGAKRGAVTDPKGPRPVGAFGSFAEFWKALQTRGAWADNRPGNPLARPFNLSPDVPGKEYWVNALLAGRQSALGAAETKAKTNTPSEAPGNFPFQLVTFKTNTRSGTRGANQPWLQQNASHHLRQGWDGWVEINPDDAQRLDIDDQDPVWVSSARGKIRMNARLYPGTRPGVVHIPYGPGHQGVGRWAQEGENPNQLMATTFDPHTRQPLWGDTWVHIERA
ncbi:MAG: molybdopterin-dependent oxidoreductase [Deltaproteobacteria bacterium]|nr:molybdopterin-dependent oxidoreductase [Deltaproteobacteria bacterium]